MERENQTEPYPDCRMVSWPSVSYCRPTLFAGDRTYGFYLSTNAHNRDCQPTIIDRKDSILWVYSPPTLQDNVSFHQPHIIYYRNTLHIDEMTNLSGTKSPMALCLFLAFSPLIFKKFRKSLAISQIFTCFTVSSVLRLLFIGASSLSLVTLLHRVTWLSSTAPRDSVEETHRRVWKSHPGRCGRWGLVHY